MGRATKRSLPILLMGTLFSLLWASAFTTTKLALSFSSPLVTLDIRLLLAAVAGSTYLWVRRSIPLLPRSLWLPAAIAGLFNNALYLGLLFVALRQAQAGLVAVLSSLVPIALGICGPLVGEPLSRWTAFGAVLGFAGVVVSVGMLPASNWQSVIEILAAVIAMVFGTLYYRLQTNLAKWRFSVNVIQLLVGAFAIGLALPLSPEHIQFTWTWGACVVYLAVGISLVAVGIWLWLLDHIGAGRSSNFLLLNPLFGILISAVFLKETIPLNEWAGAVLIIAGVALVQLLPNSRLESVRREESM